MKQSLLDTLVCPACRQRAWRCAATPGGQFQDIRAGSVVCTVCAREYPIVDGVLDLVTPISDKLGDTKLNEIGGWRKVIPTMDPPALRFLEELPFVQERDNPAFIHWYMAEDELPVALKALGDLNGKRVLDIGTSVCWTTRRLAEAGADAIAVDLALDSMKLGSLYFKNGLYFERLCADAENLPFHDGTFDFVFCCAAIHHFADPGLLLKEVARVLKSGGKFVAMNEAFRPLHLPASVTLLHSSRRTQEHLEAGINEQVFSQGKYESFFREAGFDISTILLRWDAVRRKDGIEIGRNIRLYDPDYAISNHQRPGIRRMLHRIGFEKALRHNRLLAGAVRFCLLNFTHAFRVFVGEKR